MTRGNGRAKVHGRREARSPRIRCDGTGNSSERGGAMVGVIVLLVIGFWAVVGRWAWKNFVRPHVSAPRAGLAGFAFAVAWFVLPVGDEILGSFRFRQLCREIPPTRYYGPIAVGPGAFFDQHGNRKWKSSDEFYAIRRETNEWARIWDYTSERTILVRWPMEIVQVRDQYWDKATGRLVVESYFRGSGGGWLNDAVDVQAGYSCWSKGDRPKDEEVLVFDRSATRAIGGNQ